MKKTGKTIGSFAFVTAGLLIGVLGVGYPQAAVQAHTTCDVEDLKGTFAFNGQGFVTGSGFPTPLGSSIPLGDVGAATFDGHGHVVGFTDEALDGSIFEVETPFEGTYELHAGPHGEGCTGLWQLQDHHPNPPTDTEGPHFFRIVLARESKGFQYTLLGGGLGPAVLSGFATLDTK